MMEPLELEERQGDVLLTYAQKKQVGPNGMLLGLRFNLGNPSVRLDILRDRDEQHARYTQTVVFRGMDTRRLMDMISALSKALEKAIIFNKLTGVDNDN